MAKIYLVRTSTGTIPSRLIDLFLREDYVHMSISLDEELNNVYSFGRIKSHYPLKGGFQKEDMTKEPFRNAPCRVYEVDISVGSYAIIKKLLIHFSKSHTIYGFNLLGLITAYLRIPWTRMNAYYCSEFIADILIKADVLQTTIHPSTIRPSEIIDELENVKVIYEGTIREYKELDAVHEKRLAV